MDDKMICKLCPRECGVNRQKNIGYCGVGQTIRIARAALHMWEEPCISGTEGSGAIFFAGCNLHCIYCQNHAISGGDVGRDVSVDELAGIMVALQKEGANNINLVTPSHYAVQIVEAVAKARANGLTLPIIYNTSAYEKVETIKLLRGTVDVYLPDYKYYDSQLAENYSGAQDYPDVAFAAIEEMFSQQKNLEFDEYGKITKGVIVRHLCLPGHTKDSKRVIEKLFTRFGDNIFISIMSQYTPMVSQGELSRKLTKREYDSVVDYALELGVVNAFIQEGDVAEESFIPDFDLTISGGNH